MNKTGTLNTDKNKFEIIIKPNRSWFYIDWQGLLHYRDLLFLLVRRDFVSKYKQTILGPLWFIIQPVLTAVVFTVIFGKVAEIPTDGTPPMLFYLCGLLSWTYFTNCLTGTSNSFLANAGIFGKVYFPRIIPPLSITIICAILFLPGVREDKTIIDRYYSKEYERMGFFTGMKQVIKQKSFMVFYASYTTFGIATTLMTAMGLYLVTFIFGAGEEIFIMLMATFLIGAMISVFIWHKYLKKVNNTKKVYTIGGFILCAALIPLAFFVTLADLLLFFFIAGLAMGCIWTLGVPVVLSDVQDDYVVRTGKNQKGMILGTWALISRFTAFFDELFITIVFAITMFPAGISTLQELIASGANVELIQWGLRFLIGIIPMFVLLLGVLVFWKFYPLDPEKVAENKAKLEKLGF